LHGTAHVEQIGTRQHNQNRTDVARLERKASGLISAAILASASIWFSRFTNVCQRITQSIEASLVRALRSGFAPPAFVGRTKRSS
jgi:hypothetical protein